jgi:hypothetical protein
MKSKISQLFLIMSVFLIGSLSTNAQIKPAYLGSWNFDAPSAPEGYTYGIIEIKKDSVETSFIESKFKIPSYWIKVKNDSIIYKTIVDGTEVLFSLKIENEANIKGNAVWSDGETQMILKKKKD